MRPFTLAVVIIFVGVFVASAWIAPTNAANVKHQDEDDLDIPDYESDDLDKISAIGNNQDLDDEEEDNDENKEKKVLDEMRFRQVPPPPSSSTTSTPPPPTTGGSSSSPSSSDPINNLINSMIKGEKGIPQISLSADHKMTVAMDNANEVHKKGDHDEIQAEVSKEAATKKAEENSMKKDQEEEHKISSEAIQKKTLIKLKAQKQEQNQKNFDAQLRLKTEQHKKKGAEEMRKSSEDASKKIKEAEQDIDHSHKKTERSEEKDKAEFQARESTNQKKHELAQKSTQEQIHKEDVASKQKRQEADRKFHHEVAKKKIAEEDEKKQNDNKEKQIQEEHEKDSEKREQELSKKQKAQAEEEENKRKATLEGRWCQCSNERIQFENNNQWHVCPSDKLLAGLYRGPYHNLANIYYYHCCKPCKEHGEEVMNVVECQSSDWRYTFNRAGWSYCPDNTFIQGFYKSNCNWIYCLEYARCCKIEGSKGRKSCSTKGSWGSSLDYEGWSILDGNQFMIGLYRSGDHYLFNIEFPNQCTYYAYNVNAS